MTGSLLYLHINHSSSLTVEFEEMRVQYMGQENPLEEEMATHSSIPAWRVPWTEEPGELQPMGLQSQTTEHNSKQLGKAACAALCLLSGSVVSDSLRPHRL